MTPDRFNLAAYVLQKGLQQPEKIALEVLNDTRDGMTYADLRRAVLGTARGLIANGLQPGAFVLLRLGNTPDFPIAYLGALAAGLVPVPTSTALTQQDVSAIIDELCPAAVLHDPDVVCPPHKRCIDVSELREMHRLEPAAYHLGPAERPGYVIYTSGTSGKPRAVLHAHRAILARRFMFDGWYGLRASDRMLHAGAFNWTYTLGTGLMDPWTIGATALIPGHGTRPAELFALLKASRATLFAAAPGVYRQALRAPPPPLPDLRHGLSAGEKMPDATRLAWEAATGTKVYEAFGMTECSTFISGAPTRAPAEGALGQAQTGRRIAILRDGTPAPPGRAGTIAVHRSDPGLMLGYFGQPEETAARFDGDWFLTGDQGVSDETGQITYLGRADDMMNAGGTRVSPLEVETVLNAHPAIEACAAVEVRVKDTASVIAAFYTSREPLEEATLMSFAAERLARYKQPRIYRRVAALPVGSNGKLMRRALRDIWETET